ncbi:MAG TPA: hypothetical protein VE988_13265 [Gemmataceae bacterium]|nr:hypothetical protein [Gemmataceae bacterium]
MSFVLLPAALSLLSAGGSSQLVAKSNSPPDGMASRALAAKLNKICKTSLDRARTAGSCNPSSVVK